MQLEQGRAGSFHFDPEREILELVWSDAELSEADVKQTLERLGEHALQHNGSNILVDISRFRFAWDAAMETWRDATVIPVYNAAGVRRFAFLLQAGAAAPPPSRRGPAEFETGYFDSREAAEAWFRTTD
jgi:hypothetical protein